jgi:hypothetical protein
MSEPTTEIGDDSLEPGTSGQVETASEKEQSEGSDESPSAVPGTDVGVGVTTGEPNSFEPEEDPDAGAAR